MRPLDCFMADFAALLPLPGRICSTNFETDWWRFVGFDDYKSSARHSLTHNDYGDIHAMSLDLTLLMTRWGGYREIRGGFSKSQ